ncbi:MAG: hypothetical protein LUG18_05580 [Candidatus Azobacteroides sp.]|nr:hypothetical protein [Candidatus Azobacteroides sp.]
MAININKVPSVLHTTYNPVLLELQDSSGTEQTIEVIVAGNTYSMTREYFNGSVTFNISEILKQFFREERKNIYLDKVHRNTLLSYSYEIHFSNQIIYPGAVNAVAQLGESSDLMEIRAGSMLTGFERIYKYPGYELIVSCISFRDGTYFGYNSTTENSGEPLPASHFHIVIEDNKNYLSISNKPLTYKICDNNSIEITNNFGEIICHKNRTSGIIEKMLPIINKCVPPNPFYVRWINQSGGWEYWMFGIRQYHTKSTDNQQFFNPVVWDQAEAKAFTKEIYKDAEEKITVGAEGITNVEFDVLSKIMYASHIEYYQPETKKWFFLIAESGEIQKDTRNHSQNLEITFLLPTPQLQY